jgi:hypothetical protein
VGAAFHHGRQDAAEYADAEEALAAGITAVGGKLEPALQDNEGAFFHPFARDVLDIEIAAAGAVREAFQSGGDPPGLKAVLAAVAAPGAQAGATEEEVEDSVSVRAKTIVTATMWTNHHCSERVAKNTEKAGRGQDAENTDARRNPIPRDTRRLAGRTKRRIVAPSRWQLWQPSGMDIATLLMDNFGHTCGRCRSQGGSMSSTPNTPGEGTTIVESSALPRWVTLLFAIAFALVAYLLYAGYTQREADRKGLEDADKKTQALAAALDKTNSRIADLKGQLDVTSQKLGLTQDELARARGLAQSIKKDQQKSDQQLREQIGAVQADTATKFGQVTTDLSGTKTEADATKADLDATKGKLSSTIGDLGVQSGLIARNHDEVEELRRLGERDIFEFNLNKASKAPEHVGPIQVALRKVDTKHYKYTLNVVADDKSIEKKDKTVGEPIQFYVRGARAPYEIVVFDLSKDSAKGYLSTPKSANAAPPAAAKPPSGN